MLSYSLVRNQIVVSLTSKFYSLHSVAYLDVDLAHDGVDLRPGALHGTVTVDSDRRTDAGDHIVVLQPRSAHSEARSAYLPVARGNLQVDHYDVGHPDGAQRKPRLVDAAVLGRVPGERRVLPSLKSLCMHTKNWSKRSSEQQLFTEFQRISRKGKQPKLDRPKVHACMSTA